MKPTAYFALAMGLLLATNVNAQQQADPFEPAGLEAADAPHEGQAEAASAPAAEREDHEDKHDPNCLTQTGSRLIRKDVSGRKCAIATGRSYTGEDLERTGARDVGHALRMLDPAIN